MSNLHKYALLFLYKLTFIVLGVKKPPARCHIYFYAQLQTWENRSRRVLRRWFWRWPITRNSNMAIQTRRNYISESKCDRYRRHSNDKRDRRKWSRVIAPPTDNRI